jgi:hypothetical protein
MPKSKSAAKYGPVAKLNFIQAVMRAKGLTATDKVVATTMLEYVNNDTGRILVTEETLILETGLSKATVGQRSLPRLEQKGWFTVVRRGYQSRKRKRASIYLPNWTKAAEERARQKAAARGRKDADERELAEYQNDADLHQNDGEAFHQNDAVETQNDADLHQNDASFHQNDGDSLLSFLFYSLSPIVSRLADKKTHTREREKVGGEEVAREDNHDGGDGYAQPATRDDGTPEIVLHGVEDADIDLFSSLAGTNPGTRVEGAAGTNPATGMNPDPRTDVEPPVAPIPHSAVGPPFPPAAEAFSTFWELCRKQVKKTAARRAFDAAVAKGIDEDGETVTAATLIEGMRTWAAWRNEKGESVDYDPTPAAWIEGECWKDRHQPDPQTPAANQVQENKIERMKRVTRRGLDPTPYIMPPTSSRKDN